MLARNQQRDVRGWRYWHSAAETVIESEEGRVCRAWGRASSLLGPLDALDLFEAKCAAGLAQELRAAGKACRVGGEGMPTSCSVGEGASRGYEVAFVMRGLKAGVIVEPSAACLTRLNCVQKLCEEWLAGLL